MLHNNMNISHLTMHVRQVERKGIGGRVHMKKGQDLMVVVMQRIGLRYKTSLCSKKGSQIKFH